jgi:hypothetical protein
VGAYLWKFRREEAINNDEEIPFDLEVLVEVMTKMWKTLAEVRSIKRAFAFFSLDKMKIVAVQAAAFTGSRCTSKMIILSSRLM